MPIVKKKKVETRDTVWRGPTVDGVTQSMLSRFLCCRERFRLMVVEGLKTAPAFNHRIEYGSMWHVCEEEFARTNGQGDDWVRALMDYCKKLVVEHRSQQLEIEKWYHVCKTQFPIYVSYWRKHRRDSKPKNVYSEYTFRQTVRLPSGRTVDLRGKFDSVDCVSSEIRLQENKTKGDIDETAITRQLMMDLQTMFYLTALKEHLRSIKDRRKIWGVRYNVVRRPLAGGKGTIRQKETETLSDFCDRLGGIIRDAPDTFFMRWDVAVTASDLDRFWTRFLCPTLEQLCDWWEWIVAAPEVPWRRDPDCRGIHFQFPYGVWNPATEGRQGDLDEYLCSGNETGLVRTTNLFPELDDA